MTFIFLLFFGFIFQTSSTDNIITPDEATLVPIYSLEMIAANKTAQQGASICIGVSIRNFQKIMSMQYSLKWDKKILEFKEVKKFGLPYMSSRNFGAHKAAEGMLTFAWYDQDVRGISMPDGHTIYELCFEVVGGSGSKSYLEFTGFPTAKEISNADGAFLDLKGTPGLVKIQ